MKSTLVAILIATTFLPLSVAAKGNRCVIKQDGKVAYSGVCYIHVEKGGSFSVHLHDGKTILPNITDISVSIVSTGVAEVRGLTTGGINSRWGTANRSKVDPACWTGSDFEVCAY
jgi:thiamine biosynthesis lipoprotein ApbE